MSIFLINSYITFPDLPPDQIANRQAMSFNGTDSYIQVPSTSDFAFGTNGFTITLWVNFNALTSSGYNILDFRSSGGSSAVGSLWINSSDGLRWYVNGAYLSADIPASSFSDNAWYNIIILNNGFTTSFYLNGASIDSASDTTSYAAAPLTIGRYYAGSYAVDGKLDEVAIFNTALSGPKIKQIYDATAVVGGVPQTANLFTGGLDSSLVYWNRMGDS